MKYLLVGLRFAPVAIVFAVLGFVALERLKRTQFHWTVKLALAVITLAALIGSLDVVAWLGLHWFTAPLNL